MKSGKPFKVRILPKLLILISVIMLFVCIVVVHSVFALPPRQLEPTVKIELDAYDKLIYTSSDIAEPTVHVGGIVLLDSEVPIFVNVQLSIDNDWNCTVEPSTFNLTVTTNRLTTQEINVTVIGPIGIENNTEHLVTIAGTYSFFPPGIPVSETQPIEPVYLNLVSRNTTEEDNGDKPDGDDGDDSEDEGFLPGFDGISLITGAVLVIIILGSHKKKSKN